MTRTSGVLEMFPISQAFSPFVTVKSAVYLFHSTIRTSEKCGKDKDCSHPLPLTREKKCVL